MEKTDPSQTASLRKENMELQRDIFSLHDQLLSLEKELEDIKEEEL